MSAEEKLKDYMIVQSGLTEDLITLLYDIVMDKELSNSTRAKIAEVLPKIYEKQSKLIEIKRGCYV